MKQQDKIQLLFDGDVRGNKTDIHCLRMLCSTQLIWTGFEKLSAEELDKLEQEGDEFNVITDIIESAECKLIDGTRFTLHWSEGSIFAVEDSALDQFSLDH